MKHKCLRGQGLVEYSLILLLIALAVAGSLAVFGTTVVDAYNAIVGGLP